MTTYLDKVNDWVSLYGDELILADGFEEALIGICEGFGGTISVAYDRDKCIDILVERDGMEYEEAVEYFEFNVIGSWVGEHTPVYITVYPGREYDTL